MQQIFTQNYKSPVGELTIGSLDDHLVLCDWTYRKSRSSINKRIKDYFQAEFIEDKSKIISETINQLSSYFENDLQEFDIPILFAGSEFQQSVWNELINIPFGQTKSYLQLSQILGDEKAIRAVATANGANAHAIIVPCHRIVGSQGDLVGYAGGLTAKKKLLQLEQHVSQMSLF